MLPQLGQLGEPRERAGRVEHHRRDPAPYGLVGDLPVSTDLPEPSAPTIGTRPEVSRTSVAKWVSNMTARRDDAAVWPM